MLKPCQLYIKCISCEHTFRCGLAGKILYVKQFSDDVWKILTYSPGERPIGMVEAQDAPSKIHKVSQNALL